MYILSLTSTIKLLYRLKVYLWFVHKEIQIDKVVKLAISTNYYTYTIILNALLKKSAKEKQFVLYSSQFLVVWLCLLRNVGILIDIFVLF